MGDDIDDKLDEKVRRTMGERVGENKNARKRRRRERRRLEDRARAKPSGGVTRSGWSKGPGGTWQQTTLGGPLKTKSLGQNYVGEEKQAKFRDGSVDLKDLRDNGVLDPTGREVTREEDKITQHHTHYFHGEEARRNDVSVRDGKLVGSNGELLDTTGAGNDGRFQGSMQGSFIYAMNGKGKLRAVDSEAGRRLRPEKHGSSLPHWMRRLGDTGIAPEEPRREGEEEPEELSSLHSYESHISSYDDSDGSHVSAQSPRGDNREKRQRKIQHARLRGRKGDRERLREDEKEGGKISDGLQPGNEPERRFLGEEALSSIREPESSQSSYDTKNSNGDTTHMSHRSSVSGDGWETRDHKNEMRRRYKDNWSLGWINHSSLFAGKDVAGAGEMKVENGELLGVNNISGHYRPDEQQLYQVLQQLDGQGVPLEKASVEVMKLIRLTDGMEFTKGQSGNALEMLSYKNGEDAWWGMGSMRDDKKNIFSELRKLGGYRQNMIGDGGVSEEHGLVDRLKKLDPSLIRDRSAPVLTGHDAGPSLAERIAELKKRGLIT